MKRIYFYAGPNKKANYDKALKAIHDANIPYEFGMYAASILIEIKDFERAVRLFSEVGLSSTTDYYFV